MKNKKKIQQTVETKEMIELAQYVRKTLLNTPVKHDGFVQHDKAISMIDSFIANLKLIDSQTTKEGAGNE